MKISRSWIPQQSIMCGIFIADERLDVSGIAIEPVLMSSFQVAKKSIDNHLVELRKESATQKRG